MIALGDFLKKWWLPAVVYLLATSPSALVLLFQGTLSPLITSQSPVVLLNTGALLLWLILLLGAFLLLQHPWLRWDEPTGTWINRFTALRYCPKCKATKIITPLKNEVTGWRCMNCQQFFYDPARAHIVSPKKGVTRRERI